MSLDWRFSSLDSRNHYFLYLSLLAGLLFIPGLGARDFWAPVEPRYAEIARVMFAKGEWIVPTVNGDLYTDKPILFFWLVLLFSKFAGSVNEWTVRLPAALSALGVVLTTYKLGKDFFTARIGFISAAVLATSARVIWEARWAHVDMLFTFFFLLSMYFVARFVFNKQNRNGMLLAYGAMALATLTKGPIGVVLPALILLAFVVARREWQLLVESRLHWGILVFLLVAAPWFILVNSATDGKWLNDFIYIHHWQRYTAGLGHRQPFYYYVVTLPLDFLPWTIFAVPALLAYKPSERLRDKPIALFFTLWFFVIFLFFTLSDTKRDLYLLPLLPTTALFVAVYFEDLVTGKQPDGWFYRTLTLVFFNLLWVACVSLPSATWFMRRDAFWPSIPSVLVIACGALLTVYFVRRHSPWQVFLSITLTMLVGAVSVAIWILPYLDQYKSPRLFSLAVNRIVPANAPLYIYADTMTDFNFYTEREVIPVISSQAELQKLLGQDQIGYLLIKEKDRERSGLIAEERILVREGTAGRFWHLIALGTPHRP